MYGCLAWLLLNGEAALAPHMQRVLEVFVEALADAKIADKAKEQMTAAVAHLARSFGSQLETLMASMSEEHR